MSWQGSPLPSGDMVTRVCHKSWSPGQEGPWRRSFGERVCMAQIGGGGEGYFLPGGGQGSCINNLGRASKI